MKIKYVNNKEKKDIHNYFLTADKEIDKILTSIGEKYNIKKLVVSKATIEYDTVDIFIKNDEYDMDSCLVSFKINNFNELCVKPVNRNYYDFYDLVDDNPYINKRVYKNSKTKGTIEKMYTRNGNDHLGYGYNNVSYDNYEFHYKNKEVDSKISLVFKSDVAFQNELFIKNLLDNDTITDINKLCEAILNFIRINEGKIEITNFDHDDKKEKIVVVNRKLKEYKKHMKSEEREYFLNYKDDKLWLTYMVPDIKNNPDMKKINDMLRGNNGKTK